MPRSVKSSQATEAELQEWQEALDSRMTTNEIRMSSFEASIVELQKINSVMCQSISELKFELVNLITQLNLKGDHHSRSHTEHGESSQKNQQIEFISQQNNNSINSGNQLPKFPKLSIPRFDGVNPRGWVRKCEQYFEFSPIHEDYKVAYASVHFDAQAECWYAAYIKPLGRVSWDRFVQDLYAKFSLTNGVSVMGEFNKLVQMRTVDEYFNQFESMRAQVVQEFDYLDENYFCASFVGGLKPEIKSRVEQFEVDSLSKAIHIARREEIAIHSLFKSHRPSHTTTNQFNQHHSSPRTNFSLDLQTPMASMSKKPLASFCPKTDTLTSLTIQTSFHTTFKPYTKGTATYSTKTTTPT
ncbi:hypothetical protein RJ640_006785 [Escallonia rubra]|uniref:Ty3 transposon capsid-like protein domain-containing protein n=1 Tax=Escallonia rubra TaxID=112253 RepID=A0AA88R2M3_9ASTE|nr:hypothetical protein RJ640_006785 [Escallonia rubra]